MRYARQFVALLGLVMGAGGGWSAQTGTVPAQTGTPPASTGAAPAKKATAKRQSSAARMRTQRIPIETAPPSPPGPDVTPAQRAADQQLLRQQEAQSAQAARITNQQVNTAQQQIDKVQNEQRIQDAPGPSQTGIVPAAGPPVLPPAAGSTTPGGTPIQDAPVQPQQNQTQSQPQPPTAQPAVQAPAPPVPPPPLQDGAALR